MKAFDIAFKDLLRSFRSLFAVGMMVVVPLMITGLIYFAFSGLMSGSGTSDLPDTHVALVNLDRSVNGVNLGTSLSQALHDPQMPTWLKVTDMTDGASARQALIGQKVGIVVIVPAGFTDAVMNQRSASLTMLADPTLKTMPGVVENMLQQFLDGISGTQITLSIAKEEMSHQGSALTGAGMQQLSQEYSGWFAATMRDNSSLIQITAPVQKSANSNTDMAAMMALIMAGMAVFFGYYTAAYTATSLLRDQEDGTLARLFTTPTSRRTILAGKFLAVFITCGLQLPVVLLLSSLLFKINWGSPGLIVLTVLAQVVAASGFGIFVISYVKNARQSGIVLGGLLTVLGMLGGLFTLSVKNLPAIFNVVNLLTPQGWAIKSWKIVLAGGSLAELAVPSLVLFAIGLVTFVLGELKIRHRLA